MNDADDGTWFNYYRSDAEQYVGHIQANGFVSINNVDGTPRSVTQLSGVTSTSTTANYFITQQLSSFKQLLSMTILCLQ